MNNGYQIKEFDSKVDTVDQLIVCVCPFNLELVNFFGPLIKTKHVLMRAIFDFSTKKPMFLLSAVQECKDFYELDIFISEYFSIELSSEMEIAISNCLSDVLSSTKSVGKQLFIESNLVVDKIKHLIVAAGMRFITNFSELTIYIGETGSYSYLNSPLEFGFIKDFGYEELNDLFLRSSINSLDCPEGLKFRNIAKVFDSLIYHPFLDASSSQVAMLGRILVGFVFVVKYEDMAEIAYLGVAEEFRSQRFGSALMGKMLGVLAKDKVKNLRVIVDEGNFPALGLYHSFGMELKKKRILFLAEG